MTNPWQTGLIRNITWLGATSALVKPIWLIFVVILCWRFLGTEGYGIFSTALWLAFIPASMTELGLMQFTIRDVARSTSLAPRYFSNLLVFKLSLAPVAVAVALVVGLLLDYNRPMMMAVAWAGIYATAMSVMMYTRAFFRAYQNLRLEGISVIVEKTLVVGFGTIALVVFKSAHATLAFMAIGMLVTLVGTVTWITRHLARLDLRLVGWSFIRQAIRGAIPLGLYSFFIVVYLRAGGVLLEYWHGETAAGEFAPAFRIVEALSLLPAIFAAALLPRLSELYHKNAIQKFRAVFRRGILSAGGLAVLAAAVISFSAPLIIRLVNPEEQGAAAEILGLLVWLFPLTTLKDLLVIALVATDSHRYLAVALALTTTVSLILDVALVRTLAVDGLIMMLVIVETLIILLCASRYLRRQ